MAVSLVVYRFDELPKSEDLLFYLGHISIYSGVAVAGRVFEGPAEQSSPYYNVFRLEDEIIDDDNLYVLFVFNPTTQDVVEGDDPLYVPHQYQDVVTSEIADWMFSINGTQMRHYSTSNGNFLFVLKGRGGAVNSMFSQARRKTIHVAEES